MAPGSSASGPDRAGAPQDLRDCGRPLTSCTSAIGATGRPSAASPPQGVSKDGGAAPFATSLLRNPVRVRNSGKLLAFGSHNARPRATTSPRKPPRLEPRMAPGSSASGTDRAGAPQDQRGHGRQPSAASPGAAGPPPGSRRRIDFVYQRDWSRQRPHLNATEGHYLHLYLHLNNSRHIDLNRQEIPPQPPRRTMHRRDGHPRTEAPARASTPERRKPCSTRARPASRPAKFCYSGKSCIFALSLWRKLKDSTHANPWSNPGDLH